MSAHTDPTQANKYTEERLMKQASYEGEGREGNKQTEEGDMQKG